MDNSKFIIKSILEDFESYSKLEERRNNFNIIYSSNNQDQYPYWAKLVFKALISEETDSAAFFVAFFAFTCKKISVKRLFSFSLNINE